MAIELVYWDSATFLAYFQEEPGRVEQCRGTLNRAEGGAVGIITSALAIAECLWLRNASPIPQNRADIVRRFFRRSFIRVRNVTRVVAESAQDLVWNQGVRPKDAIHVATALEARLSIFETFDEGLRSKSLVLGTPPLLIREPAEQAQAELNV